MTIEDIRNKLIERFASSPKPYHKRIVIFWEDPNKEFVDAIGDLDLSGVRVIALNGQNLFEAKKVVNDDSTGNLLIYDPLTKDPKDDWIMDARLYSDDVINFDFYSMVMSELGILENRQLGEAVRSYEQFWKNEDRIKRFKSLCPSAQTSTQVHFAVMAALVGAKEVTPAEILFRVFSEGLEPNKNKALKAIEAYGSPENLWKVMHRYAGETHQNLDNALTKILCSALYGTMGSNVKGKAAGFVHQIGVSDCQGLVMEWLKNPGYSEEAKKWIKDAEAKLELAVTFDNLGIDDLLPSEVFPAIDESILKKCFDLIANGATTGEKIIKIVEARRVMNWYLEYAEYYACLLSMGEMLQRKDELGSNFSQISSKKLWDAYAKNYFKVDADYRHIHYHYYQTTLDAVSSIQDHLIAAIDAIENIYKNWFLNNVNDEWAKLIKEPMETCGLLGDGIRHATEFFDRYVDPRIGEKVIFVFISDGMRYEIAKELGDRIAANTKGDVTVSAIQSVFPSITKYGMPALLPGKKTVDGSYNVLVNGMPSNSLEARRAILQARISSSDAISFNRLVEMKTADLKEFIKGKDVIYVYHDAIDGAGHDSAGESKVFDEAEPTIQKIITQIKKICGVRSSCRVFVTSDHGFIYTYKQLTEAEKFSFKHEDIVDALGEKRCFVAKNPVESEYLMKVHMVVNNEDGSLVGYAPLQTIRFKAHGGSSNYVHGGLSLQEMMVPVVEFDSVRTDSKAYETKKDKYDHASAVIVRVTDISKPFTTNVIALAYYQEKPIGLASIEAKYQIFIEDAKGVKVTEPELVLANKTSDDASERQLKVVLNLKAAKYDKNDVYFLTVLNLDTGAILTRDQIHIDGDFSDDFGF